MLLIPTFELSADEFNELVSQHFKFSFDFKLATGEPGATYEYHARPITDADPLAKQLKAHRTRSGKRCRDVSLLLNVLVTDGVLSEGTYFISTRTRTIERRPWKQGRVRPVGVKL